VNAHKLKMLSGALSKTIHAMTLCLEKCQVRHASCSFDDHGYHIFLQVEFLSEGYSETMMFDAHESDHKKAIQEFYRRIQKTLDVATGNDDTMEGEIYNEWSRYDVDRRLTRSSIEMLRNVIKGLEHANSLK